jgi:hypothetical protein
MHPFRYHEQAQHCDLVAMGLQMVSLFCCVLHSRMHTEQISLLDLSFPFCLKTLLLATIWSPDTLSRCIVVNFILSRLFPDDAPYMSRAILVPTHFTLYLFPAYVPHWWMMNHVLFTVALVELPIQFGISGNCLTSPFGSRRRFGYSIPLFSTEQYATSSDDINCVIWLLFCWTLPKQVSLIYGDAE